MIRVRPALVRRLVRTGEIAALAGLPVLSGGAYAATATAAATDRGGSSASARATTHDKVWEREDIPFRTITRETNRLDKGVRRISQPGKAGVRVRIVKTTFVDGLEVDSKGVRNFVDRKPCRGSCPSAPASSPSPPARGATPTTRGASRSRATSTAAGQRERPGVPAKSGARDGQRHRRPRR